MPTVRDRFSRLPYCRSIPEYNFTHFRAKHLWQDAVATWEGRGIIPGTLAPDFVLPRVGGGTIQLSELRGTPVLLHFGSFT